MVMLHCESHYWKHVNNPDRHVTSIVPILLKKLRLKPNTSWRLFQQRRWEHTCIFDSFVATNGHGIKTSPEAGKHFNLATSVFRRSWVCWAKTYNLSHVFVIFSTCLGRQQPHSMNAVAIWTRKRELHKKRQILCGRKILSWKWAWIHQIVSDIIF